MCELAGHHVRVLKTGVAERDIAGAGFARGFLGGVLAGVEVARCLVRNRHCAFGYAAREERHRGDQIARKQPDVGIDIGHPGEGREAKAGGASNRSHVCRAFVHQHHVEDHEQRPPGGEVEESRDIALECERSGLGQQEQREEDRKQGVEQHGQHDVEQRHPFHRGVGNRAVGPLSLDIGAGLGVDIDATGPARAAEAMHRLAHRIDRQRLLEDVGRARRDPGQVLVGDRQIGEQLGLGERGGLVGIELAAEHRAHRIDQRRPLRVQRIIGLAASDDRGGDLARGPIAGEESLRAGLTAGRDGGPNIAALGELFHRIAPQQHVVEHALPEMLVEVGCKFGIGNAQAPRRVVEPRAVDHTVL